MIFPNYKQFDESDCGPACIQIIAKYYGKYFSLYYLREKTFKSINGVSLLDISNTADIIGFRTTAFKLTFDEMKKIQPPFIVHWRQKHFVVVYKIKGNKVYVSDPAFGKLTYSQKEFKSFWGITEKNGNNTFGFAMAFETTPYFYMDDYDKKDHTIGIRFFLTYLKPFKNFISQIFLGFLIGAIISLLFPFLTQAIVDIGINQKNINFIYIILLSQLVLFFSQNSVDFIRNRIFLYIGTRLNISLISDYLVKLMKLPISFYTTKSIGDLLQRIGDHSRIQSFLTSSTLNIIFSFLNFIIFSIVLIIYNFNILLIFLLGSIFSVGWIFLFMKKRKELDYKKFNEASTNQNSIVELITGMQEIKLNSIEKQKRWEWEEIQAKLFNISISGLNLNQYQQAGTFFINQSKNILITILTAKEVINGNMTLGMMMATSYILGQLNSPLEQLLSFLQSFQDAKISLDRIGEIYLLEEESVGTENNVVIIPESKSICISDLCFQYGGKDSDFVIGNLSLHIPEGKITAIVGLSGSGKTTLIKLLLKFYKPTRGDIKIGGLNIEDIDNNIWRKKIGVVMQDGFIFNDTINNNITLTKVNIDNNRLQDAIAIANVKEFLDTLPLGGKTKICGNGMSLSQGQRQRILIARAVYKNPELIILDEATSDLDTVNERIIMDNLLKHFKNKTILIVAHRLSTVVNADQIAVLQKGNLVEIGNHISLIQNKNMYFNLIKNQLELN